MVTGLAFSPDDAMHCVAQGRRGSAASGYRSGAALLPAGHVDNHFNGGRAAAFGNQRGKLMGNGIIFGLSMATLLMLLINPLMYELLEGRSN